LLPDIVTDLFEDDPRFRGMGARIRWFLAIVALLALVLLGAIASKQDLFTPTLHFYFFAPNAHDLNKGMPVKLIGFKIGKVEAVSIEPNATVKVLVRIDSDYARMIGNDARAKLTKEGLIGQAVIEIAPGAGAGRPIVNFDVLEFERDRGLSELAQEITAEVKPILKDVKEITAYVKDPEGDVRQTLRNVSRASAALQETTGQVRALAAAGKRQVDDIGERAGQVLGKAGIALDRLDNNLKAVEDRLPGLLLKTDATLDKAHDAADQFGRLARESREQVPPLAKEGRQTLDDAREIMHGLKESWPLRSMMPAPDTPLLPADSHDAVPAR
jgi:phospholipid/cholesterol/gamma-HCH transport system substrate-binding protein